MRRISIAEANKNLSNLAKLVKEDGIAILTKHGKDEYVFMSKEYYEDNGLLKRDIIKEIEKGFYRKSDTGEIVHVTADKGIITIYTLRMDEDTPTLLSITTAPEDAVEFRGNEEDVEIRVMPRAQVNETFIEPGYIEDEDEKYKETLEKMLKTKGSFKKVKIMGPLEIIREGR